MSRFLMVTNAAAGTSDETNIEAAATELRRHGEVRVVATSSPDELDDLLASDDTRNLVVTGGDGSLHAVVQSLHASGTLADRVLGLVPLGTGNDFAGGTGVPLDPTEAARLVGTGTPRDVDLLVDSDGVVVVNNVHLGLGAHASRTGAGIKQRLGKVGLGRLGYPLGVLATAFRPAGLRLRVEVDDRVVLDGRTPVLMVAIGNGTRVGGGAEVTPEAEVHDGAADVMVSTAVGGWERLRYGARLLRGRVAEDDRVEYLRGTRVRVSGEEFWVSADGEITGPLTTRTWTLLPGALRMVLP